MEKVEFDVMKCKLRDINEGIFVGGMMCVVISCGVLIGIVVIIL